MGVATGCGCKEVYRFRHTTYPYSSCFCSFLQQHPYFLFIVLNVFHSCLYTLYACMFLCVTHPYYSQCTLLSLVEAGSHFFKYCTT